MTSQFDLLKRKLKDENIDDNDINDLLESSKLIILNRRYPFGDFPIGKDESYSLEQRYYDLQIRIAIELFSKEGVEGQTSHTENGISRTYASAGISDSLLNEITPKGKVI